MNKLLIADLNLHLEYKFTDRAGRQVFEIFNAEDYKTLLHPLGTIRIEQPMSLRTFPMAPVKWVAVDKERHPLPVAGEDFSDMRGMFSKCASETDVEPKQQEIDV